MCGEQTLVLIIKEWVQSQVCWKNKHALKHKVLYEQECRQESGKIETLLLKRTAA